jgi:rhamnosyltransferase
VRARDEARSLPQLIEGIRQQSLQPLEVILVDSGSTDETCSLASDAGWRVLHITPEDFTFGRALNRGCKAARGDILVIMSAHVYPIRKDYFDRLTAPVEASSRVVVYGRQVGDERTHFSEKMVMSQWFPNERIPDQGHAFSNNANSCVSRVVWEELTYDESLSGLEDIDFSLRLLSSGGQVLYQPDPPVVHVHEESFATVKNRYRREALAYKKIFPGEKMSWASAISLFAKNVFRDLREARRESRLTEVAVAVIWFRCAQFLGAWQGFRDSSFYYSELHKRMYHPTTPEPRSEFPPDDPSMLISYSRRGPHE